jgi:hypothetical protein
LSVWTRVDEPFKDSRAVRRAERASRELCETPVLPLLLVEFADAAGDANDEDPFGLLDRDRFFANSGKAHKYCQPATPPGWPTMKGDVVVGALPMEYDNWSKSPS